MVRGYLRFRRPVFALYFVALSVFAVVQRVYGQDLAATGYAALIVTFLLALCAALDYFRFAERARALDDVLENLSGAAHALPEPVGPMETRYHALSKNLYAMLADQSWQLERLRVDQLDYYTTWVHQIKTPIAAMRLLLSSGAKPEATWQELFKVERYVEMALQYVKSFDLSTDLVIGEYPLGDIIRASVKKYAPLFIGKRIKVEIGKVNRVVVTDSKWLSFILEQLLSNAVKYTQSGKVRIFLISGDLVVEDTGIGIRREDMARIFQKGYTGYNGRVDQRASGIGLYMAKRVADQLAIRIYAESTLGKGTRMTLTFPKRDLFLQ